MLQENMAVVVLVPVLRVGLARCCDMPYLRSVAGVHLRRVAAVVQYAPLLLESVGLMVVVVPLVVAFLLVTMVACILSG